MRYGIMWNEKTTTRKDRSFNIKDAKGRVIGASITTGKVKIVEQPDHVTWRHHVDEKVVTKPGTYLYARVQLTKDYRDFGASQPNKVFSSDAARKKFIANRLKSMERRAIAANLVL